MPSGILKLSPVPLKTIDVVRQDLFRADFVGVDRFDQRTKHGGRIVHVVRQDDHLAAVVIETETTVDILTAKIMDRLIALRSMDYTPHELSQISQMMLAASDIERISDYAENIAEYEGQYKTRKAVLSDAGSQELRTLSEATLRSIDCALDIFEHENFARLPEAEQLEQEVDTLYDQFVNAHIHRLMKGECNPVSGVIFTDMSSGLERCSDHAINVACSLSENPVM